MKGITTCPDCGNQHGTTAKHECKAGEATPQKQEIAQHFENIQCLLDSAYAIAIGYGKANIALALEGLETIRDFIAHADLPEEGRGWESLKGGPHPPIREPSSVSRTLAADTSARWIAENSTQPTAEATPREEAMPGEGMRSAEEWRDVLSTMKFPWDSDDLLNVVRNIQSVAIQATIEQMIFRTEEMVADARRGGPETGLTEAELLASIPDWYDPRVEMPKESGLYIVRLKTGEAKIIDYYNGPVHASGWEEPYHDQVVFWMPVEHLGIPKPADIK